ncbi:MAG: hypothetical protein U0M50_10325 [Paramuribaculum sp.]
MNNGNVNNNNKNNTNRVRPVAPVSESAAASATSQVVYDIPFSTIIEAWIDCEANKKSSNSCTKFRWHAARDLVQLWQSMRSATYQPRASMCFMVKVPVLREVWAGAFRDRVAHHWENLRFGPVIEKYFVDVGDRSMNCRRGYGSLRAVATIERSLYEFTDYFTRDDCWIVGGDFANFFMSLDKSLVWEFLEQIIMDEYTGPDKTALLYMMHTTLFHRCQDNFFRKSPESMWKGLPPRKSLFHMDGLPIGNLPSQIWANFIGAIFTQWVIFVKKIQHFVIFVDDWRALVRTREQGRRFLAEARAYLRDELHVTLHPDKVYLQHWTKGTRVVGAVIKPRQVAPTRLNTVLHLRKWAMAGINHSQVKPRKFAKFLSGSLAAAIRPPRIPAARTFVANRTRGAFITAMRRFNCQYTTHADKVAHLEDIRASINSYLGLMCHYQSYKVRRRIALEHILPHWGQYLYFEDEFRKCIIRKEYDKLHILRRKLKSSRFARRFIRPHYNG